MKENVLQGLDHQHPILECLELLLVIVRQQAAVVKLQALLLQSALVRPQQYLHQAHQLAHLFVLLDKFLVVSMMQDVSLITVIVLTENDAYVELE